MRATQDPSTSRGGHPWAQLHPSTPPAPPGSERWRPVLLGGWVALLVAVLVGFSGLGRGALATPDLTDPGSWSAWAAARTAPEAAFAVVRIGVQVTAGYLLLVTILSLAAAVWQGRRMVTVVELVTLPAVRRMVQGMVGVTLAGASVAAVGAGPAARVAPTTADVHFAGADQASAPLGPPEVLYRLPMDEPVAVSDDVPVMRLLTDEARPVGEPRIEAEAGGPVVAESGDGTWVVQPGEHLWSVSEQVLADGGSEVSDRAVAAYVEELVEANLDRFADAGNPDLLFPGQVLVVPPPPAPSGG